MTNDRATLHLTIGTIALVLGVTLSIYSERHIFYGAILVGIVEIARGVAQRIESGSRALAVPERGALVQDSAGGVRVIEDVNATWKCPKCDSGNPNTSFVCATCGLRLV